MSKFCQNCGKQLDLDAKFCGLCGTISAVKEPIPEQTGLPSEASLSGTGAGEIIFDAKIPKIAEEVMQVINPFKVLFSGAWNIIRGIGMAFKDKKKWIPALIIAAIWFVLTLLPALGVNSRLLRGLSWITFAQGGSGMLGYPNWIQMVGGIVGKGVFASLVFSLLAGGNPLKKMGNGLKIMFSSYSCKGIGQFGTLLIGIGLAFAFYNFMAGFASLSMSMAGISALLLTLRALGSRTGFLRKFFGGLTAEKTSKGKSINTAAVNKVIAGIATGFALSIPISALNTLNLPYILGGALLIAGISLIIIGKSKKEAMAA